MKEFGGSKISIYRNQKILKNKNPTSINDSKNKYFNTKKINNELNTQKPEIFTKINITNIQKNINK